MISVKVPATTANIGPGFDLLGMAIDRYNTFTFEISDHQVMEESHLVYRAYKSVFKKLSRDLIHVSINVEGDIPVARGLGSSAACIVAGIMGANRLLGDPMSRGEVLDLATELEGHPDNVAPAIFGGLVLSIMTGNQLIVQRLPVSEHLRFITLIPDFELSTALARRVLPQKVDFADAVYNAGRLALLLASIGTGETSKLGEALKDRLHQPYRSPLIDGYERAIQTFEEAGAIGAYLSGAGPTIIGVAGDQASETFEKLQCLQATRFPKWSVELHQLDKLGAYYL